MNKKSLEELFKESQYDRRIAQNSRNWFRKQSKLLQGIHADQVLREGGQQTSSVIPGYMYAYYYSPKYKATLPYYDTFPLVIPFGLTNNGFIGLNLHYLPPYFRVRLLDRLMEYASSEKLDDKTKIKYSWALASRVSTQKWAEQCVHRYLAGHVKSRFVKIHPQDWFNVAMLPVARFQKQSQESVWKGYS